jgi:hypothetical protein
LSRWFREENQRNCSALLSFEILDSKKEKIVIANTAKGKANLCEDVAELNGLAIPAMLEVSCGDDFMRDRKCRMYEAIHNLSPDELHPILKEKINGLCKLSDMESPAHYLELAAVYIASAGLDSKGYISRVSQLKSFDWMSPSTADKCLLRLKETIEDYKNSSFEVFLSQSFNVTATKKNPAETVTIVGMVDILSPTTLWEIKCVNELTPNHLLQLATYAWLWKTTKEVIR